MPLQLNAGAVFSRRVPRESYGGLDTSEPADITLGELQQIREELDAYRVELNKQYTEAQETVRWPSRFFFGFECHCCAGC